MILIISEPTDPAAQAVARLLSDRGHGFALVDRGDYPASMSLTYAIGPGLETPKRRCRSGVASPAIDLGAVRSIWWRRPGRARAASSIEDQEIRRYVETSAEEVFGSFLDDVACLHVPARRSTVRKAREKIPQLSLARTLGLEVPDTVVTNDVDELLEFYHRHGGNIITKTTAVGIDSFVKGGFSGYTRPLRPRDLVFIHDVVLCPITAQAYVDKSVELRVTVVGSDIFAAEIHSQSTRQTRVDWRHYDDHNTTHRVHTLPDRVARACLELLRAMDLVFGAIDLVLTPDGRYVFLEVNPNGQYQWIEEATGLPISARIATLLRELA
jgi:hypothetical protein